MQREIPADWKKRSGQLQDLVTPDNDAEAQAIANLLDQNGIQTQVISFHDTAYDGLFQAQRGWGIIRVHEEEYEKAKKIIEEWRAATPSDLPWAGTKENSDDLP